MDKVVWDRFYYKLVSVCKQQLVRDKAHGQIISFGLTEINAEINFSCVLFSFQSRIQKTGDGDQSVGPWNVFLYMQYLQEQSQHMFQCEVFHFCFFFSWQKMWNLSSDSESAQKIKTQHQNTGSGNSLEHWR